ncbi:MFS transporter [Alicyclobacillus pomorum]|uniref:MFS transporter n=1 Tax=Alicyclobacillus pomorum TaxID=204470 RepID=UPI001FE06951|nr:MFS transporter [Alicyclobacillus pomorum]
MVVLTREPFAGRARWLLVISGIFALSVSLSNTFVNVYLWKVDKSYGAIGWYNLAVYCVMPVTFVLAGWIAKRVHSVLTLRIGICLHGVFYLTALIGGTWVARWPTLLGAIMGLAGGFYWCSFNELSLRFTESGSRDRFYGLNGVMGAVAGIVAPPVAGYLISQEDRWGGLSGYHWIFGLSLALFALATVLSAKLRAKGVVGNLSLTVVRESFRVRPWRMILFGCSVYGLREGVFLFLIALLMYIATGSELKLGEFVLLQSALSFVSFYTVSRLLSARRRLWFLGTGSICMALTALLFLLPVRASSLVWYGALISVALPLFLVPLQGFVFDTISQLPNAKEHHMEYIIMREVFENVGRVVGISLFIALVTISPTARTIGTFAVGLGFVQLITWWLIYLGQRERTPMENTGHLYAVHRKVRGS